MADVIRWGILGAAKFAREHMAPAIHMARNTRLAAVATRDPAKAAPFQALDDRVRVHDSYDALLADAEVDAVYIPLPNDLHVPWGIKALHAGKHVLIEKPVGLSAPQIDDLIAARDATGLHAAEAYMIAHHPQWALVRRLISEGAIGQLGHISGQFTYNNAADPGNIRNQTRLGSGSLPDIGVYPIGAAAMVTGAPGRVVAADLTYENGVETHARLTLRFGDVSADVMTSMRLDRHQQMTFFGTEGRLHLTAPFNPRDYGLGEVQLLRGKGPVQVHRFPIEAQYVAQVEAFGDAIRGRAAFPWTLEDARRTQAIIDAAYAACPA